MDPIIAQIKTLAQNADEATRLNIVESLRKLQLELQTPKDTLIELAGSVSGHYSHSRLPKPDSL